MAVRRPDDLLAAGLRVGDEVGEEGAILLREGVADGVGQVDGGRAGLDHRRAQVDEEVGIGAPCVLRTKLDVEAFVRRQCAREGDHLGARFEALSARHVELVLQVDVRRREESVHAVQR